MPFADFGTIIDSINECQKTGVRKEGDNLDNIQLEKGRNKRIPRLFLKHVPDIYYNKLCYDHF